MAEASGSDAKATEKIVEINITETERRCAGSAVPLQDIYVAYQVESVICEPEKTPYIVWRRYSDFEVLHSHLQESFPYVIVPPLPERKVVMYRWQKLPSDRLDPDFVERRRASLELFLRRVAGHPELSTNALFLEFLKHEASWRDELNTGGLLHRADSMLRSLNATLRLRNPDTEFEEVKSYSGDLQMSLSNILRIRAKLADRTYGLHQLHQNYGRVLSEWSRLERGPHGDELQRAGQFMDKYAQCALPLLEEQEQAADALKEYLFYAGALGAVCKHHDILQYELEKKEALFSSKESQHTQITGQSLMSRLLSPSSPEERANSLELQLETLQGQIQGQTREKKEFAKKARAEIAKFQVQKDKDIKDALILYVKSQIELCNESISIWKNLHSCFEKM
ncbi:unnamed protein product [Ixodes hexagonus]